MTPFYCVVEGIDGSGKSTLVRALAQQLGLVATREPTQGPHSQALRQAFAHGRRLSPEDERSLVEADRCEHIRTFLNPALARGVSVISDRSYYSTAAYQGISPEDARTIVRENEVFAPRPDVVLYLDLPPAFALARIQSRSEAPAAPETYDTLQACASRYEAVWADADLMTGVRFVRLDARASVNAVLNAASQALDAATRRREPMTP